jgi:hypothetical protein
MPVTTQAPAEAETADIEFVLQQLAALEPMGPADVDAGCNGCHSCASGN